MQLNSLQRAVTFIKNVWAEGGTVSLKADGSPPAALGPSPAGQGEWSEERLASYLQDEVRLGNFQRVMQQKGFGSIYLISPFAGSVLHIRVLPGSIVFHYVD